MGRQAGLMTAGVLGMGLMGCGGCDCGEGANAGLSGTDAKRAEMCTAVNQLSASLAAIPNISPSTSVEQLQKVRAEVDLYVPKVIDKQGLMPEDTRTSLKGSRNEFVTMVNTFGSTSTVGSAAPRFNPPVQDIKGRLSSLQASDCPPPR